jgi:hypothetical protein
MSGRRTGIGTGLRNHAKDQYHLLHGLLVMRKRPESGFEAYYCEYNQIEIPCCVVSVQTADYGTSS